MYEMKKQSEIVDEFERKHGYEAAERAAIYEYDAGMTRDEAEHKVRIEIDAKNHKERKCQNN
jgi:hypothetical protein